MSAKRTKLSEKKTTIRLKRVSEVVSSDKQKPAAAAVAAFQQLTKVEPKEEGLLPARFRIIEKLGQGAMGTVYRVHDDSVGQELAAKVLSTQWLTDSIALKRFEIEAAAAGDVGKPGTGV